MRKILVFMTVLLFCLVGCHQPSESYHKAVNKLQIVTKLKEVEVVADQCSQSINLFIASEDSFSSYQEKMSQLDYQNIIIDIKKIEKLTNEIETDIGELNPIEEPLIEAHIHLETALAHYKTLINYMELAFILSTHLDQYYYDIKTVNQQILELSFSGEPVTDSYKKALNDFLTTNKEKLIFMDLAEVEILLSADSINIEQLEVLISNIRLCNNELKLINTYSNTDQEMQRLIIEMYEYIMNMYVYILDNTETIEWMNGYDAFSTYYEEQKVMIDEQLTLWQEALK